MMLKLKIAALSIGELLWSSAFPSLGQKRDLTVSNLPNHDLASLRRLPDDELVKYLAGWKPDTEHHVKAEWEMWQRKNQWTAYRAWLSITIALLSLAVAIFSALS